MYPILLSTHSWLRWILLAIMLVVLVRSLSGFLTKSPYLKSDNLLGALLIAFTHTQLLLGYVLYFFSPFAYQAIQNQGMGAVMKDKMLRAWSIEHITMMTIAGIVIQVGRSLSKKQATDAGKHQRMLMTLVIAFALIVLAIPADRLSLFRF